MTERLLIDTTFLVAVQEDLDALDDLIGDADDIAVAAITVAELRQSAARAGRGRADRDGFVDDLLSLVTVVPYDQAAAEVHADLASAAVDLDATLTTTELVVAATAASTDRTLVTLDKALFDGLPGLSVRT